MYHIPHFKANNHQEVLDFMQAHPFVTICGVDANGLPVATHIPVLIQVTGEKITISGHIMRKQDHTIAFESKDRKSTRLNSSHVSESRMPSSA